MISLYLYINHDCMVTVKGSGTLTGRISKDQHYNIATASGIIQLREEDIIGIYSLRAN